MGLKLPKIGALAGFALGGPGGAFTGHAAGSMMQRKPGAGGVPGSSVSRYQSAPFEGLKLPTAAPGAPNLQQMRQQFFSQRRGDLGQQRVAQSQEAGDLIARRMAAIGQSGSGAAIGLQNKAMNEIGAQNASALNDLAGQELQANEAEALADKDMGFKKAMFDVEQNNKLRELDMAREQLDLDKETTGFNRRLAEMEMNAEDPGLLGSGGFLGTGLGGSKGILGTGIGKKKG